jgi:hypothetical protein
MHLIWALCLGTTLSHRCFNRDVRVVCACGGSYICMRRGGRGQQRLNSALRGPRAAVILNMGWVALTFELALALSAVCLVLHFADEAQRTCSDDFCSFPR